MLKLNKFMLALAFIGGSAAAQASTEATDIGRVPDGKRGEKYDRVDTYRRIVTHATASGSSLSEAGWSVLPATRAAQAGWAPIRVPVQALVNGRPTVLSASFTPVSSLPGAVLGVHDLA